MTVVKRTKGKRTMVTIKQAHGDDLSAMMAALAGQPCTPPHKQADGEPKASAKQADGGQPAQPMAATTTCRQCRKEHKTDGGQTYPATDLFCSHKCAGINWAIYNPHGVVPVEYRETDEKLVDADRLAAVMRWAWQHRFLDSESQDEIRRQKTYGLLLHGYQPGTGKTRIGTLAAMFCAGASWFGSDEQEDYGQDFQGTGLWLSPGKLRERYNSGFEQREQLRSAMFYTGVLMLDDLDKLNVTVKDGGSGISELIHTVIDERLHSRRITIITCNSSGPRLAEKLGGDVGEYTVSRIRRLGTIINFDTE
jgi:hypothetical protein